MEGKHLGVVSNSPFGIFNSKHKGAVAAAKHVLHPISVARKVMENSEHCLIVGEGVERFMKSQGIPSVPTEELLSSRELGSEKKSYYQLIFFLSFFRILL